MEVFWFHAEHAHHQYTTEAILGMHNIVERPVAINGQAVIRPMMYVALSYDHRIIDGRESVGFLVLRQTTAGKIHPCCCLAKTR